MFLQQLITGLSVGSIYALMAVGYSLIWYKISIAPEADMKPRRLCLFCYNGRAMDGRFLW